MSEYQNKVFWHQNVDFHIDKKPLESSSDIVIVGAGFTGLATALHLLRAGKSVTIFDAMTIGEGASGKNGGMVGPSLHKLGLAGLTNAYGRQKALEILQEGMTAISYFQEFIAEENIDCDLKMTGRFRGVTNEQALEGVKRDSENLLALDGFKYDVVEKQNVHDEIGSDLYQGGVIYHQDGGLQPYKLVTSLATKVTELGGIIHENTRVSDITKTPNGFQVETTIGTVSAGDVVVASNAYTKKFGGNYSKWFSKRLLPITSAMIATEELPKDTIDRFFPKKRMHGGNHRLVQYYRASPDHKRVLFGARGPDRLDRADKNGPVLKEHLCKIFPELENVKIDYSWSGRVAYTFDHTPHLGIQDGIYYAIGYCGSGVTRSIYLARQLSRRILGQENHQTAFDDLGFKSKPFYNGNPWFMPAVLKWHSFLDRIEGN
ncbi:NAD(P)/FAD-dependent oxidoreductase [Pseudemcibacter aquimaris]|uniref:NAD(P)/FAD-dependent oxidoreductase n=1 Tax=Pseudemcibacter aquimaris TaxID=2857064 RepID=UPI00201168D0|nr:FAD-binding oxidoreductase [Pseudemcibacter aquimaris]MCC3861519.1 FAD-binding oxidoreductase [Pseudemcibacter aquimaris]WDU58288.1 FAD-binding oxidoreductase [Pseudemcibacter aquimaris]